MINIIAVESTAIACFLHLCEIKIPEVFSEWEFRPVFDGLQADFMMRHKSFPDGIWVPIQMKSARIEWGKQAKYFRTKAEVSKYKEVGIYCIAIGLLEYDLKYNPKGPDDIDYSARIYEILDNREYMTVCPYPATLCEAFPPHLRCFVRDKPRDCMNHEEAIKTFLTNLFANIQNWPVEYRYAMEDILYGRDTVNARCHTTHKTENEGIEIINKAVVSHGGTLQPPWRQHETVDSIITLPCGKVLNISHKTAGIKHKVPNQRRFDLNGHPNDHFCDFVIASYSKQLNKVAVMERSTVCDCETDSFCWNEYDLRKGVFIFDLENAEEREEFFQLLRVGEAEFVKSSIGQKHQDRRVLASAAGMNELVPIGQNKKGIKAVSAALASNGGKLTQSWRQHKTDDSTATLACDKINHLRHKTASIQHNDSKQRQVPPGKRPVDQSCDYIVANYAGQVGKVAVIEGNKFYSCGKTSFYWNEDWGENKLAEKGVFIFDLESEKEKAVFVELLRVGAAAYMETKKQRQKYGHKKIDGSIFVSEKTEGDVNVPVGPVLLTTDIVTTTM